VSKRAVVYLCLGSNQGDRAENLRRALTSLSTKLDLEATSSVYETDPVGYVEQPCFLNLVCRAGTELTPTSSFIWPRTSSATWAGFPASAMRPGRST